MALAQAIIEFVRQGSRQTLFSTHYELTALEDSLKQLRNVHVGAVERDGDLVFLHQMQPGPPISPTGFTWPNWRGCQRRYCNGRK